MNHIFPTLRFYIALLTVFIGSSLSNVVQAQTEVTIGTEETSTSGFPINTCMGYNFSQMIYTSSELEDAGLTGAAYITKIAFKAGPWTTSPTDNYKDWVVHMGNTGFSEFASSVSWVPLGMLEEVFDGELPATVTTGTWMELTLSTPFYWDGVSNIIISINETTPGWFCAQEWASYWATETRSMIYNHDAVAPDPLSPPPASSTDFLIPMLRLEYEELPACTGTSLEEGTISGYDVCALASFTIANSGSSEATGIIRQWQMRSPSGTGEWTDIAGAVGLNYINTAGITEPTDYRCIVTCESGGVSIPTNEVTVGLNPSTECYCDPIFSSSCDWEAQIDDFYTLAAITNISNLGTSCSGTGYTDYSEDHEVSALQLQEIVAKVKIANSDAGVKIWVDWNQDGIFDSDDELVGASSGVLGVASTFSTNFVVPATALPGTTKMRVAVRSWETFFDPCMSEMWDGGEVEDYAFTVIEAEPCEDLELIAGTLSSVEVCPSTSFTVVNTGTTLGAGMNREWQRRVPAGTGDWVTIPGATSISYYSEEGITVPADFRCIVSCPSTGESDTTNTVSVVLTPFDECYCEPSYIDGCMWSGAIDNFETTGAETNISNLGTGCPTDGSAYTNYTSEHIASIAQLQTMSAEVTIMNGWGGVKIWVDYNHNGIFESSEKVGESIETLGDGSSFTTTFTIPLDAMTGLTRMRVMTRGWGTDFGPCDESIWEGETEDYALNILPAPNCADVTWPSEITSSSAPSAVCGSGTVFLNLDIASIPLVAGVTYQWEASATGETGWTNVGSELSGSPSLVYDDVSGDTYFRCKILCNGTHLMYSDIIFVESVEPESPVVVSGQHCGPGAVELSASIGAGFIYWYEEPDGGLPFAVGETIMTPEIDETTTFYAKGGAFPPALIGVGEGLSVSSSWSVGPFNVNSRRYTMQLLYTAEQLQASGATAGTIEDLRFYLSGLPSEGIPDYRVSIKYVPASTIYLTSWHTSGFTEVFYSPFFEPDETGWQTFPFDEPLFYDGTAGIIVQVCWSGIESPWSGTGTHRYTPTTGQMLYRDSNDEGNSCGDVGTWTSNELPNVVFSFIGCVSDAVPVEAYIRDVPSINIFEEDGTYCLLNDEFTLHSFPEPSEGHTLLWGTGETSPSVVVGPSAPNTKFWIEVTNEWGCQDSDTVTLTLNPSPEVDLGPDVLICEGGALTLDAGPDGETYFWSTGANTREITIEEDGEYIVYVTNDLGCMSTDTINVETEGYAPQMSEIIVDHLEANIFRFTPHLPMYIESYTWDFGDGSDGSAEAAPVKEYAGPGTYLVTCTVTSSCTTRVYTTYVSIFTSVDEEDLQRFFNIYPNPTDDHLNVEVDGLVNMETIRISNVLGQTVLEETQLRNPKSARIDVTRLPSGTYHINIKTDKGNVVKTFQVVK